MVRSGCVDNDVVPAFEAGLVTVDKVLTERDSRFTGSFSAENLARALNDYAAEGWRVVNSFTAASPWKSFKAEILVIMERETGSG